MSLPATKSATPRKTPASSDEAEHDAGRLRDLLAVGPLHAAQLRPAALEVLDRPGDRVRAAPRARAAAPGRRRTAAAVIASSSAVVLIVAVVERDAAVILDRRHAARRRRGLPGSGRPRAARERRPRVRLR